MDEAYLCPKIRLKLYPCKFLPIKLKQNFLSFINNWCLNLILCIEIRSAKELVVDVVCVLSTMKPSPIANTWADEAASLTFCKKVSRNFAVHMGIKYSSTQSTITDAVVWMGYAWLSLQSYLLLFDLNISNTKCHVTLAKSIDPHQPFGTLLCQAFGFACCYLHLA